MGGGGGDLKTVGNKAVLVTNYFHEKRLLYPKHLCVIHFIFTQTKYLFLKLLFVKST